MRQRDKRSGRDARFNDMRLMLMLQTRDFKVRGKGNKAWKRAEHVLKELERVTVDPYAIAKGIL